ncbi:hypothetical protein TWF281_009187 [Arthrobotrys megalospora]
MMRQREEKEIRKQAGVKNGDSGVFMTLTSGDAGTETGVVYDTEYGRNEVGGRKVNGDRPVVASRSQSATGEEVVIKRGIPTHKSRVVGWVSKSKMPVFLLYKRE